MEMNLTISGKTRNFFRVFLMSLLLGILMLPAEAQNRVTVSGRLTDTGQNPLIGASVIEKGTTNGVTTDVDGRYSISVDGNATLDFSFIGYKAQSIAVMNRTQIDVVMEDDAMMIGEVVAIGYGSQRKEDLSMAVTTVKLDDVAKSRSSNLATMLQGRMPGVTIQQTGDPMKPASFSSAAADRRATTTTRPRATAYWWLSMACPTRPTWSRMSSRSPCSRMPHRPLSTVHR